MSGGCRWARIVALAHDLVITGGVYALSGFEVTPATVTGLLTILGFSLYDTVVVFDKVRENTKGILKSTSKTYAEQANLALNQTLVRSINTSITALLPVGALLIAGAAVLGTGPLKDLALALFVGMLAGTYSSIFIATPFVSQLKEREPAIKAQAARVLAKRAKQAEEPVEVASAPVTPAGRRVGRLEAYAALVASRGPNAARGTRSPTPRAHDMLYAPISGAGHPSIVALGGEQMKIPMALASAVLLASTLAACGGGDGGSGGEDSDYCKDLKKAAKTFGDLSSGNDLGELDAAFDTFHKLADEAPSDIEKDWKKLDGAITTVEKALKDAGTDVRRPRQDPEGSDALRASTPPSSRVSPPR